jgi:hypothetical protein
MPREQLPGVADSEGCVQCHFLVSLLRVGKLACREDVYIRVDVPNVHEHGMHNTQTLERDGGACSSAYIPPLADLSTCNAVRPLERAAEVKMQHIMLHLSCPSCKAGC